MPPLVQPSTATALSAAPRHLVGLSTLPAAAAWASAVVLVALALRSAARLVADRAPIIRATTESTAAVGSAPGCALTSRAGDAIHLAMAAGMVPMVVPLGVPPAVLVGFFGAITALVAGSWLRRVWRRRLAVRRGGAVPCRPAHALEPHHVIIGLAMIVMAWQMAGGTGTASDGMSAMPGMTAASGPSLGTLALIYTWSAVVILGCGLAKAAASQPAPAGVAAILSAPTTVYTCELAMTIVMGVMLLG